MIPLAAQGRLGAALAAPGPRRAARLALLSALVLPLAFFAALAVWAATLPLPSALVPLAAGEPPGGSVRVLDREGHLLVEVLAADGSRARWVPLAETGKHLRRAMVAAEDRRFFEHPGIDPLAMTRAAGQALLAGRVVSGASTLTQQLARTVEARPRTVAGKLREMALALRIEASLSKAQILEAYLNLVDFGPGLRGVEAASRRYFDKPCRDLSLAEAATLAGIPRGPVLYDPARGTSKVLRRRNRVLARMEAFGLAGAEEAARARAELLAVQPAAAGAAPVHHFARGLLSGALGAELGREGRAAGFGASEADASLRGRVESIETTLDRRLQREVVALARAGVDRLAPSGVTAASVVVVENATGEILAYVGSPDALDAARLGANDGLLAERQPGSALKPFVYELAMEHLGLLPSTLLADVEVLLPGEGGVFSPRNYDGRFHGPVRAREALASSYNVPAVRLAADLGPERVLERLRALGLASLGERASHYGAGIALGDGEVTLLSLANAYATLARGGVHRPLVAIRQARAPGGARLAAPALEGFGVGEGRRVLDPTAAHLVTHMLADPSARIAGFGRGSALELPFPVAAKTGTSKSFRDNVAVGFTPEVTVAVWVGNFDGSPMHGVSGVTGAGPLFQGAMLAAMRGRQARSFEPPPGARPLEEREVCALSGASAGPDCPHRVRELFPAGEAAAGACGMHERVAIDARNGLRAGPGCTGSRRAERVFEIYPPRYRAWALEARRPSAPEAHSPLCPAGPEAGGAAGVPRIAFPAPGTRFSLDPALGAPQSIRIRVEVPRGGRGELLVDGRALPLDSSGAALWRLEPGEHTLVARAGDASSEPLVFSVD